jgi:hypothetical protein
LKISELQNTKTKTLKVHKNKAHPPPPPFTPKNKLKTPKMTRRKLKTLELQKNN